MEKQRKAKVLIVSTWYPTKDNPVAASFIREQGLALRDYGNEVAVLCIRLVNLGGLRDRPVYQVVHSNDDGIDLFECYYPSFGGSRLHIVGDRTYKAIKFSLQYVIRFFGRPDVIHAHVTIGAGYGCVKLNTDIPIVVTEHTSDITQKRLVKREIKQLAYTVHNANEYIAVSGYLRDCIYEIIGTQENINVIPNMLNHIFDEAPLKYSKSDTIRLCSVSNLVPIKRIEYLIHAFALAFSDNPTVILSIAGQGPERDNLLKLIDHHGLNGRVTLLGQLDRQKVVELMQNSDAFVMVSKSETFGIVYAEAMALGLPTLGTLNGGSNDILCHYGAIGIEVTDDVEILAKRLRELAENCRTYNREKISRTIRNKYSEVSVARSINDIYEKVMQQR